MKVLGLIESSFRSYSARFIAIDGEAFGGPSTMADVPSEFLQAVAASEAGGLVGNGAEPIPGFDPNATAISTSFVAVPVWVHGEIAGVHKLVDELPHFEIGTWSLRRTWR